jgi:hypothetical protein
VSVFGEPPFLLGLSFCQLRTADPSVSHLAPCGFAAQVACIERHTATLIRVPTKFLCGIHCRRPCRSRLGVTAYQMYGSVPASKRTRDIKTDPSAPAPSVHAHRPQDSLSGGLGSPRIRVPAPLTRTAEKAPDSPTGAAKAQLAAMKSSRIEIVDGDTVRIDGVRMRVFGCDAPDIRNVRRDAEREWGKRAAKRLHALLDAGPIQFNVTEKADPYRRPIVWLGVNGKTCAIPDCRASSRSRPRACRASSCQMNGTPTATNKSIAAVCGIWLRRKVPQG